MVLTIDDIKTGHVYRAKRPAEVGSIFNPVFNDRQIVWINEDTQTIQYDSPAVHIGRTLPKVSFEKFLKWAGMDVTEGYPEGPDWAKWNK